jgi:hypothetical protein
MSIFLFSQIGDPTIKKISQIWLQSIYKMIKKKSFNISGYLHEPCKEIWQNLFFKTKFWLLKIFKST